MTAVSETLKRHIFDSGEENDGMGLAKQARTSDDGDSAIDADSIKQMMMAAKQQIEHRKAAIEKQLAARDSINKVKKEAEQSYATAMEKAKKADALKARIQDKLKASGIEITTKPTFAQRGPDAPPLPASVMVTNPSPMVLASSLGLQPSSALASLQQHQQRPASILMNSVGQVVDAATGEVLDVQTYKPSLMANIRAKQREHIRVKFEPKPAQPDMTDSAFYDARIKQKLNVRTRRGFRFVEPGRFAKVGQQMRAKNQLERLQSEIFNIAKKAGLQSAAKLAAILPRSAQPVTEIPPIEWWDQLVLRENSYNVLDRSNFDELRGQLQGITELVQHPMTMKPPVEPKDVTIPIMLTKAERKKLRRQTRREAQREDQEKIRLGLVPPPEPKVRIANLMRVLGNEAIQDPTKIEQHVRAQMAKRQRAHEEANAARKLTDEQRGAKKAKKLNEDVAQGVVVAVYRVSDLSHPQRRFKVEMNAKQRFLSGLVTLFRDCNVIYVEGGARNQSKFQRLMLQRIKWNEDVIANRSAAGGRAASDSAGDAPAERNSCQLIWQGEIKERLFNDLRFKNCPTESFARDQFRRFGLEHLWDLAFRAMALQATASEQPLII